MPPQFYLIFQRDWLNESGVVELPGSGGWCEAQVDWAGND